MFYIIKYPARSRDDGKLLIYRELINIFKSFCFLENSFFYIIKNLAQLHQCTRKTLKKCKKNSFPHKPYFLFKQNPTSIRSAVYQLQKITQIFLFFSILGQTNVGFFDFICRLHTQRYKYAKFPVSTTSGSSLEF